MGFNPNLSKKRVRPNAALSEAGNEGYKRQKTQKQSIDIKGEYSLELTMIDNFQTFDDATKLMLLQTI